MNRTIDGTRRSRLSLSRKRKKEIADRQDTLSVNVITDTERDDHSSADIAVHSEQDLRKVEQNSPFTDENKVTCNSIEKLPESVILASPDERRHKKSKKGITAWLNKPQQPNIVSCPMCAKAVFLSKINQHLDSNCELHINNGVNDHVEETKSKSNCKAGSCNGLNLLKGYKHNVTETNNKNGIVPLKVSDSSDLSLVASLARIESKTKDRNEHSSAVSNDCDHIGVCNNMTEGDSPAAQNHHTEDMTLSTNKKFSDASKDLPTNEQTNTSTSEDLKLLIDSSLNREGEKNSTVQNTENMDEDNKDYEPYYLANFKLVLTSVLSNEDDKLLFNEQDNYIIDTFNGMSADEQKLYIRLFQRKHGWFRCVKLEYPKICKNLKPILDTLTQKGFLDDEHELTDLREALNLIAAPELKLLVKSLHLCTKSAGQKTASTKEDTIETIVSHAENQKTLFGSFRGVVLKRAKQALGSCVRLTAFPKDVFCRILLLFTMNVIPDDEDSGTNNGQTQQLSTLFLANIGKVLYPSYVIDRPTPVFHSRESLMAFTEAFQQKHEMFMALESNSFDKAFSYYPEASKKFDNILTSLKEEATLPAVLLPEHLRCFSAEWAVTKMCYFGVEVFQKWRQYDAAVNQLEKLLEQDVFCFDSRGRWYDRLALNLHQHLKRPEKAMEVIRQGLSDPHVRFGRRLALIQRAKRIISSPAFQKGKKKKSEDFADLDLKEPNPSKSITISGTRCAELGVFISPEINQDGEVIHGTTTFCAVEEYALSYYRQEGFDQGIHGEGSTYSSLYCLFMWDIIFSSGIPDVFRSPFQASPLDICFDSFYTSRKDAIDRKLEEIRETPFEKLQEMLSKSWNENEGKVCAGLNWDIFTDVKQAKQLVGCLGGTVLSGIFDRFAKGYRYHRSGLPDLVVWNSTTLEYRIAEVKGPGDKLSTKQQIWLEVLDSLGANVEVCYVTDVGAKRLKVSK